MLALISEYKYDPREHLEVGTNVNVILFWEGGQWDFLSMHAQAKNVVYVSMLMYLFLVFNRDLRVQDAKQLSRYEFCGFSGLQSVC